MRTLSDWYHLGIQKKLKAWAIVIIAGLFFFYEFIQLNMFNSLNDTFQTTFALNAFQVGLVSAFYLLADSILLYPVGSILDRVSSKKMIVIGMIMCVLGTLLIASAHNSWFLVGARFMAGLAAAFCLLSILRLGTQWFPAERMGQVTGVVVTMGMIGGAASQAPLTWVIQELGWRSALYDVAYLGMIILVLVFIFVRDVPAHESFTTFRLDTKTISGSRPLYAIIKDKNNWLNGFYVSTMNLPIMILAGLFGTNFMSQGYGFNQLQASSISMMVFIGTIVGSTLVGIVSDALKQRRRLMIIAAWISLFLFVFILFGTKLNYMSYLVVFFLLGLITAAQVISYPVAQELNSRSLSGAALGFISVIIMALPMILQPLTGWIMDFMHQGAQGYILKDYQYGLSVIVFGFAVSIYCAYSLPETYGVNFDDQSKP